MARDTLSPKWSPPGERSRREHVDKMSSSLKAQRRDAESDWHSIADYSGYGDVPGLMTANNGKQRPKMRQLMDSHPILAFRTVQGGMYSGLSSPNRPWLRFKFADEDLNSYQAAAEWIDDLEKLIYSMFDASNFYQSARQNYGEMARFGPAAGIMTEHWREIAPTLPLPIGSFWLGFDDAFKVDTLMRHSPLTVDQVVKQFVGRPGGNYDWSAVSTHVKNKWDNSDYGSIVNTYQLIEPGADGKWDSTIWDCDDDRKNNVLETKFYAEQPFWAPRWDDRGVGGYGRGVGHDSMADMRELHMQAKRKRELTDLLAKPPTVGPAKDLDMRPGAHTYVADMTGPLAARPIYDVNPMAIGQVREDIAEIKNSIDRLTMADLFMAITNMQGVQPRNIEELVQRDNERMQQIGPVVEIVNDDMLPKAVDRMIGIARRGGLIKPAPEELQGKEIKVEFVSVLAQAMKMMGLSTTERVIGFAGSLGSVFGPQVLDKIDPDAIIDDYADRANLPAKAIRDAATVAAMREGRQQQEQMAQAAAMAQPAKDATQAAANIAEMSNNGAQF